MVKLWRYGSEEAWLRVIKTGDASCLNDAFEWASTEEGAEYWNGICCFSNVKLSQKTRDRVAYLYAEWKLLGDIDDGGGRGRGQEEWEDWEESTGENG